MIVEHDNHKINPITLNTITAAKKLPKNESITCLVIGTDCGKAAEEASKIEGVNKVLLLDNQAFKGFLPETLAPVIVQSQQKMAFSHIMFGSTAFGKNLMPRVAALLDVQPFSDIIGIDDENTFIRTIYAGNAIQTVRSKDALKIVTVRGTAFEAAKFGSVAAPVETAVNEPSPKNETSTFVGQVLSKSDRPSLPSARVVVR